MHAQIQKKHARTKLTFLLGYNIAGSISPSIQNAAFRKVGFNAVYSMLEVPESSFSRAMRGILRKQEVLGFNVTAPYKEKILPYITKMDRQASEVGAVNTVKIVGKNILGFNTDVDGTRASLKKIGFHASNSGKRVLILGAGGGAKACIYTALKLGFDSVAIMNRTDYKAKAVAKSFAERFEKASIEVWPLESEVFSKLASRCELVINAISKTPQGSFPIELDFSNAKKGLKLFDLGYKEASLPLKLARKSGVESLGGLLMLVEQGARAFEIWTGIKAPRRTMMLAARRSIHSSTYQC